MNADVNVVVIIVIVNVVDVVVNIFFSVKS
jgi:hypothetical protein